MSELLHVAMVVSGDLFGGAERMVLTLCRAGSQFARFTVVTTLPGPVAELIRREGVEVLSLADHGSSLLRCARNLRENKGRFDVFHCHGYRSAAIVALAQQRGKIPVVRTMHGAQESGIFSRGYAYELCGKLADHWSRARKVFVSRDLMMRMGGARSGVVIHNGVNAVDITRMSRPNCYSDKELNVVAVGRLDSVKNFAMAIDAVSAVGARLELRLHIIGDGPQREALISQSRNLGVEDRVSFHGFQSDVYPYLRYADALIITSRHEGIPFVLLEALSMGTPVIATSVGGIPEVVRDGKEGILIDAGDVDGLATALMNILTNKELQIQLSSAGKIRINEAFSAELMFERYQCVYGQIRRHSGSRLPSVYGRN